MKWVLGSVIGILFLCACEHPVHEGYKTLDNGIHYQLISFSAEGKPIAQGDMVRFLLSVYQGDSLGWSEGVESVIQADDSAKGLKSLLGHFEVDDSIGFRIDKEVVAYDFGSRLDTSLGYGAIRMKLLEAISEAKWQSDEREIIAMRKGMERERINAFLDSSTTLNIEYQPFQNMYWRILEGGERAPIGFGQEVIIGYECYALDGSLIDVQRTDEDPALTYKRGMQGVLIPGLEKLILMMPEDAMIEAIIPSDEAYGRRGVPVVGIRPWMPLRFIIRLQRASDSV